jgi:hypothetical protein
MTAEADIPIARPPLSATVRLDERGCLDEDVPCRKCGYNLRGLSPDGRCPECGVAIGRSLQGDYLRFADPQWVQTLASGMNWILAAIVMSVLDSVAGSLAAGATRISLGWAFLIGCGSALVSLVGYWKVTTPDPAGLEDASRITSRKVVRFVQVARLVIIVMQFLVVFSRIRLGWPALVPAILLTIVGLIAVLTYARQLALRIPDQMMAGHCRRIMWGGVILFSIQFAMLLGAPRASIGPSFCVLAFAWIILLVWSVHLIELFRTAFKEAARQAAATWAAAPPPT